MSRNEIRFGVGEPDGMHSNVYRLWTNQSDVYLAVRDTAGLQKVSLHASGRWRWGFTSESGMQFGGDRAGVKWVRPAPNPDTGMTKAFRVNIPASEIAAWPNNPRQHPRTTWFVKPPDGWMRYFTIYLAPSEDDWIGEHLGVMELVAQFHLTNSETVWLLSREIEMSDVLRAQMEEHRAAARRELRALASQHQGPSTPPRAFAIGDELDGTHFFVDISLGNAVGEQMGVRNASRGSG